MGSIIYETVGCHGEISQQDGFARVAVVALGERPIYVYADVARCLIAKDEIANEDPKAG